MQVQKLTVSPLADITSIISGTEATWPWEVTEVYENGATIAFTWDEETKILDIPTYGGGVVLVEFNLYLIFNAPSQYLPSDPTNPASPLVFWENRLSAFISYSTSIKSFETGLTEITIGSFGIRIDDEWLPLIQNILIFTNRIVRIYLDDVIKFKGITTRSAVSNFTLTVTIQKRQTVLDSECSWGDPDYLNRINRSSTNAYYTGSSIPKEFENAAIPMLFGSTTPYELGETQEIDLGTPGGFFLLPPTTKGMSRSPNTNSFIVKVIPTGTSTGILGRMPSYQTLPAPSPINEAITGGAHIYGRYEQASNAVTFSDMILGENCVLERTGGASIIVAGRIYGRKTIAPARSYFFLGYDDPPGGGNFTNLLNCDRYRHFFAGNIPRETWVTPAVLSSTLTPAGHRFLTISGVTGLDLTTSDLYVVLNNISGARSGPKVMEWALQQHGYTVSAASFTALNTLYPDRVCMQVGFGTSLPTLGTFISEINRTLLTVLVFPASNDQPYLVRINPTAAASQTISEDQITGISWGSEYRDQTKNVIFSPQYFRSDDALANLTFNKPSPRAQIWASERTLNINHVLEENTTNRFTEIADFYGSPVTPVKFTLLDDEVQLELADMIQLDHREFQKKIIITAIEQLPQGRAIQGRYLYVNNN
jgi:hypothetical protein